MIIVYVAIPPAVSCGAPTFASGVTVEPFSGTTVGSEIFYQCQQGLPPKGRKVSVCGGDRRWSPNPATLMCAGKVNHISLAW